MTRKAELFTTGYSATETATASQGSRIAQWLAPHRILWAVWGLMLVTAFWFVARFGSDVPYWDEWGMVPVLSKTQAVTLDWLWMSRNGHRIPVPRLLILAFYQMSGHDFRAGMYVNVLVLGFASAVLMGAARRQRRYASRADVFFPLLLLHLGHYENLLWTWQFSQVMPTVVVLGLLALAVRFGIKLPMGWMLVASIAVVTLPLSGMPGLAYTPPLALWVAAAGWMQWRAGGVTERTKVVAVWALMALSVMLVGLYFRNYPPLPQPIPFSNSLKPLGTALRYLAGSLGPSASRLWPGSVLLLIVILILVGITLVRSVWLDGLSHRVGALVLFWVGIAALAASVGFGRPGVGFTGRYFLLAAPALCAAYVTFAVGFPQHVTRMAQGALCAIVFLALPMNSRGGLSYARDYHARMEAFRADVFAGHSPSRLAADHGSSISPCVYQVPTEGIVVKQTPAPVAGSDFPRAEMVCFHDWLVDFISMLKATQNADYHEKLNGTDNVQLRELQPSALHLTMSRATSNGGGTLRPPGDAALILTLEQPLFVTAVRVQRNQNDKTAQSMTPQWMQLFWRVKGQQDVMIPQRYVFKWYENQTSETIWIYQNVDQISLHVGDPDRQQQLDVNNLPFTLLVPSNEN